MKYPTVCASDIGSYAACPKIVYYRKVLEVHTKSTVGQALGLFEHETRRRFYTHVKSEVHNDGKNKTQLMQSIVVESINETLPYVLLNYALPHSIHKFKQNITSKLLKEAHRISHRLAVSNEALEYTLPFSVEVPMRSNKLRLAGRVDCLLQTLDGFIPVDFKTFGKNIEVFPHELQITAYAMLVEEIFSCEVNHGLLLYTEDDFAKTVETTAKRRSIVVNITNSILQMLNTRSKPDTKYRLIDCNSCSFFSFCKQGD